MTNGRRGLRLAASVVAVAALLAPVPAVAAPTPVRREAPAEVALRQATTVALRRLARTERRLPAGRFPTVAVGSGRWHTSGTDGWLAGFWPGRLWLAYELTGRPVWARRAAARQAPLAVRQDDSSSHDLGFLLQTSFGAGAALAGRPADAAVTRRAAAALASRWVPAVGALRSWDGPPGQVTVIVDSLMNLELLFRAADRGGDPAWRALAHRHALTVARWNQRADGSTFHVVRFDETTGRPVWRGTVQGRANGSTWARGQAWAVHGFATAYAETGDPRLLRAARRAAGYAVAHAPADGVPWWDYSAPGTRRDSSAGAVLASGLLDLARLDPDPGRRARWRAAGMHTLLTLAGPRYLAARSGWAVLRHARHSPAYPDVGATYGDYYLLEALVRVQLLPSVRPALRAAARRRLASGALRVDLGRPRRVTAVSVRWRPGAPTAFRIEVSDDGRHWVVVRRGVSSADSPGLQTYDLPDRVARLVRVDPAGPGSPTAVRVRG